MLFRKAIIEALISGEIYHSGMPKPGKKGSEEEKAFEEWCDLYVRECSIDLTIATEFWFEKARSGKRYDADATTDRFIVDMEENPQSQYEYFKHDEGVMLAPKRWGLGRTEHIIGLSENLAGEVHTRSTAGRYGLCVRRSAGLIDPGFKNYITLEIHNDTQRAIILKPNRRYAQITFYRGEGAGIVYSGHYQGKRGEWSPEQMLPKKIVD